AHRSLAKRDRSHCQSLDLPKHQDQSLFLSQLRKEPGYRLLPMTLTSMVAAETKAVGSSVSLAESMWATLQSSSKLSRKITSLKRSSICLALAELWQKVSQSAIQIKDLGFSTRTIDICTSACAFIWLAGRERSLVGSVGFHTVYIRDKDGNAHADPIGNNVVA